MIGNNISKIRKNRGYSLSELAYLSNVSKSYLSNIERNINKNPSLEVMNKIATVLKVDISSLVINGKETETDSRFEQEWVDFINDLKELGIQKYQVKEYKTLIEFIKWRNENSNNKINKE